MAHKANIDCVGTKTRKVREDTGTQKQARFLAAPLSRKRAMCVIRQVFWLLHLGRLPVVTQWR